MIPTGTNNSDYWGEAVEASQFDKSGNRMAEAEFGDMPIAALDDPRVRKEFLD
jgi:hypothetical protein